MNIAHHFLALRSAVPIEKDARSTITLEEIADICSCTVRNAKLLIKQMTEHGWIRWFPGRGRGNRSSVQFLKNVDDIAVVLAEAHIDKGNLQKAFALLDSFEVRGTLRDSFIEGVYQRLGYQMETIDDGQLEILRFPFYRPIPRLDPMFVTRRTEAHMVKQLFDTLVCYDAAAKVVKPHLAHFWESSGDGTVWTFNLRKGVLFHHKRELTAHDVAFTLDRLRTLAAEDPFYRLFVAFKKVEVVSNTMIRIHIGEPNFLFLHFLTATAASIVPRDAVFSESVEFTRMPIGSGPFRLRRNDESLFCMEAFAPYFQGRPHLDRVELWIMPEVNDRFVQELAGQPVHYIPFGKMKEEGTAEWLDVRQDETGSCFICCNLQKTGVVQQALFREALDLILDRQQMIDELGGFRHSPAVTLIPQFRQQDEPDWKRPCEKDLLRIPQLLEQCGYKGEMLRLFTYQSGSSNEADAKWVQRACQRYGVNLEVHVLEIVELQQPKTIEQADLVMTGEVLDDNLEISLVETLSRATSFLRRHLDGSTTDQLERLLAEVLRDPSPVGRMDKLRAIDRLLSGKRAVLYLYHSRKYTQHHHSLSGVQLNSFGWADYRTLWFKKE